MRYDLWLFMVWFYLIVNLKTTMDQYIPEFPLTILDIIKEFSGSQLDKTIP